MRIVHDVIPECFYRESIISLLRFLDSGLKIAGMTISVLNQMY